MAFNSADTAAFKNVWVFCEQRQGVMMPTTFELISEGRKLANELGVELCGILLGDNVKGIAAELGQYGADKVYVYDSPLLKDFTTGAGNDIERATALARKMVCEWGMSDQLGPLSYGKKEEQIFLGREFATHKDYSEETAQRIDAEVARGFSFFQYLVRNDINKIFADKRIGDRILTAYEQLDPTIQQDLKYTHFETRFRYRLCRWLFGRESEQSARLERDPVVKAAMSLLKQPKL